MYIHRHQAEIKEYLGELKHKAKSVFKNESSAKYQELNSDSVGLDLANDDGSKHKT